MNAFILSMLSLSLLTSCSSTPKQKGHSEKSEKSKIEKVDPNADLKARYKTLSDRNKTLKEKENYTTRIEKIKDENALLKQHNLCLEKDDDACLAAGDVYLEKKNESKAREMWKRACDNGTAEGCYKQGLLDQKHSNFKSALPMFAKGCEQKHAMSCNNLAFTYYKQKDLVNTRKYFTVSCELGLKEGCNNVAQMDVADGKPNEARDHYQRACLLGDKTACDKVIDITHSLNEALVQRYQASCEGGQIVDCYNAGYIHMAEGDRKAATALFERACSENDSLSCAYLGILVDNPSLRAKADEEYEATCLGGNPTHCFYLAAIEAFSKHNAKSIAYLTKACEHGFKDWDSLDEGWEFDDVRGMKEFVSLESSCRK